MKKPLFCDLGLNEKCNMKCRMCYIWKYGRTRELEIEECKRFIFQLKEFVNLPFEINLGGGEPLLRKDIFELINICFENGFRPAISTNASLIDKDMAKRIGDSGLVRLSISLASLDEDTHDFLRGVKGSYRQVMNAIEYLGIFYSEGEINIHTIIEDKSLDDVLAIAQWVHRHHYLKQVYFQAISFPFFAPSQDSYQWYKTKKYEYLWPQHIKKSMDVIDELIVYKKSGGPIVNPVAQLQSFKAYFANPDGFARDHPCNFGDHMITVDVLGNIYLCCDMKPLGNIGVHHIQERWFSSDADRLRNEMYKCQKTCNNILNCYFVEE